MGNFITDLFKKKRKIVWINNDMTVFLNDKNKTQLVFHDANQDLFDFVNDKANDDLDVVNRYNEIIVTQNNTKIEQGLSPVAKAIAIKEERKQTEIKGQEKVKEEIVLAKKIESFYPLLTSTGDFNTDNSGCVFMNKVSLSVPKLLIDKFLKLVVRINDNDADALDEYVALKNFWMWCSLCPNAQSREDLFKFIDKNGLKVNKNGFFFAYRSVDRVGEKEVEVDDDEEDDVTLPKTNDGKLSEFISNSYLKIKGAKKSPKNFSIFMTKEYPTDPVADDIEAIPIIVYKYKQTDKASVLDGENIGVVFDLYQALSSTEEIVPEVKEHNKIKVQTYTDNHTKSMDIRIGREVSLPPERCDWDNLQECSNGLHVGAKDYGCGNTPILVLVNPMNTVAVPNADCQKMRVRAYFPVAVLNNEDRFKILDNIDTLELADEYLNDQVKQLNSLIEKNSPKELVAHRWLADLSPEALKLIAKEASSIEGTLATRVIKG